MMSESFFEQPQKQNKVGGKRQKTEATRADVVVSFCLRKQGRDFWPLDSRIGQKSDHLL